MRNQSKAIRFLLLALAIPATAAMLEGCEKKNEGNLAVQQPAQQNPDVAQELQDLATAQLQPKRLGSSIVVDGCNVQAYRVGVRPAEQNFFGRTSAAQLPEFTMATVTCPTGSSTTTSQSCGKNCRNEVVTVRPGQANTQREAQLQEISQLEARLQTLKADLK